MNRIILFLLFFCFALYAKDEPKWAYQHHFELKKDEWAKVYVADSSNKEAAVERDAYWFRWTLYDGKQITIQSNYRKFPKQHTLTKQRGMEAIRQVILADPSDRIEGRVELLLVFTDFDQSKKYGNFDIFVKDSKKRVLVEFDDPRRKRVN